MKNNFLQERPSAEAFPTGEKMGWLILQNIKDSYLLVDTQLLVVCYNKAAREYIRQFLGLEVYPGMHVSDLNTETRWQHVYAIYQNALLGQQHTTESKFPLHNGCIVYFENTFLPAYNDVQEIVGVIVLSKDITDEKKAQQAIQESEERLQFALEAANQGAWEWNLETDEVIYSASYKRLYGFAENELKNHVSEWITRIHPDDQQRMQESVKEHLSAEDPVYDSQYRIRGKDGRYRWVMAKGCLVAKDESGKPLRMIGTHTDITESIERVQALKQINERFDCMMKATHDVLWEWDLVADRFFCSADNLRKVYGVADNSTLEKIEDWLQRIHPEDRQKVRDVLNKMLAAEHQQTFELEYRFRKDDQEYAFVYDRSILLRDENDRPVRVIGSTQDISERKRLEKELLQNELEYQKRIHQAMVESQEEESAVIGKELHDNINQVLTTTKLYLDLALTSTSLKDDLIAKGLTSIGSVIQEIRQLSRSLMDPSLGDLGLLEAVKDLIENIHLTQKIKIQFEAEEKIETSLDPDQKLTIFRILQESFSNILQHAKATTVSVGLSAENGRASLIIKDNGIGFRPEAIKRGAGLKNIQSRIYLINGTLQIESRHGEGCTLHLQFPIK